MRLSLLTLLSLLLTTAALQAQHISDFTSISPIRADNETVGFPESSHAMQLLIQAGDPLTVGGVKGINSDFTGYVPINGSSTEGYLDINSEFLDVYRLADSAFGPGTGNLLRTLPLGSLIPALDNVNLQTEDGGDVTVLDMSYNSNRKQWEISASENVNFVEEFGVPGTGVNCSGAVTPWGTSITCEEINYNSLVGQIPNIPLVNAEDITDLNGDGWYDLGWCVEVDPVTRDVVDYDGDGQGDKLWQMGNMAHENKSDIRDGRILYWGEDDGSNNSTNYLYKFVADNANDLSSGTLYTLVRDSSQVANGTGTWVQVPNKTKQEQNEVVTAATNLGAYNVPRVEDVEWNPLDSFTYVISTNLDQIIRYNDNDTGVTDYEVWVDNIDYVTNAGDTFLFNGPDNMAIDDEGNIWVLEDNSAGGYIYMVDHTHTPQNPNVQIFGYAANGAEPTGITFTPDYKFMFLSIQHPSLSNTAVQTDAVGCEFIHDRDATVVFALNNDLGASNSSCQVTNPIARTEPESFEFNSVYPNPVKDIANIQLNSKLMQDITIAIHVNTGKEIYRQKAELTPGENTVSIDMTDYTPAMYYMTIQGQDGLLSMPIIKAHSGAHTGAN